MSAINGTTDVAGTGLDASRDDEAIDLFAAALKEKMALSRLKGRSGWPHCTEEELLRMLKGHVDKGDMRDVALIAMMLWHNAGVAAGLI